MRIQGFYCSFTIAFRFVCGSANVAGCCTRPRQELLTNQNTCRATCKFLEWLYVEFSAGSSFYGTKIVFKYGILRYHPVINRTSG